MIKQLTHCQQLSAFKIQKLLFKFSRRKYMKCRFARNIEANQMEFTFQLVIKYIEMGFCLLLLKCNASFRTRKYFALVSASYFPEAVEVDLHLAYFMRNSGSIKIVYVGFFFNRSVL